MAQRGSLLDQGADCRATREADVVYTGMSGKCVAHFMTVAGNDVDGSGRESNFCRQFGDANQRQACVLSGFDYTHVTSCQRAAHAAPEYLHGVVPRNDVAGDAVWFTPGHDAVAILIRDGVSRAACHRPPHKTRSTLPGH